MLALDIIKDAYRAIGVIGETETPSAEQGAYGVTKLNDMMAGLAESGLDFGYAPVSSTTSTVVIRAGFVEGIKAMLAIKLAANYGAEIPPSVIASAESGERKMLNQAIIAAMREPEMLDTPLGAGNRDGWTDITNLI